MLALCGRPATASPVVSHGRTAQASPKKHPPRGAAVRRPLRMASPGRGQGHPRRPAPKKHLRPGSAVRSQVRPRGFAPHDNDADFPRFDKSTLIVERVPDIRFDGPVRTAWASLGSALVQQLPWLCASAINARCGPERNCIAGTEPTPLRWIQTSRTRIAWDAKTGARRQLLAQFRKSQARATRSNTSRPQSLRS